MGENEFAPLPTALYGLVLLLASSASKILLSALVSGDKTNARLKEVIGRDWKWWLTDN